MAIRTRIPMRESDRNDPATSMYSAVNVTPEKRRSSRDNRNGRKSSKLITFI